MITLKQYILSKGISTQEFANMTGLSYSYIARIKNKKNPPVEHLKTIEKIAEATKKRFGTPLRGEEWLDRPYLFIK